MGLWDDFTDVVGDVAGGVGHAAGWVGSALGETVVGMGTGLYELGKGVTWAADPYHWDDIQHGAADAARFAWHNPGATWDVGFEIGRHMVKEELLDPKHLAANLAITAATFGAGAAIRGLGVAGEVAEGAEAAGVGGRAIGEAGEAASVGGRGARIASRATSILERAPLRERAVTRMLGEGAGQGALGRGFAYSAKQGISNLVAGEGNSMVRNFAADMLSPSNMAPTIGREASDVERFGRQAAWAGRRVGAKSQQLGAAQEGLHDTAEVGHLIENPMYAGQYSGPGASKVHSMYDRAVKGVTDALQTDHSRDRPSTFGSPRPIGGSFAPISSDSYEGAAAPAIGHTYAEGYQSGGEQTVRLSGAPTVGRRNSNFYSGMTSYGGRYGQ